MSTTSELLDHLRTALSSEVTTDEAATALGKVKDGIREIDQLRCERDEARKELAQRTEDILKSADMIEEYRTKANRWCDLHTVASKRSEDAMAECTQLRTRVAELEKDKERYHWLCRHLSSDWMIEEVQKAWNLIIDQHKAQK